jgi:prepilin-type processing-associated H-X9-DG protein
MDPLPHIKLRKALEILLASVTTSQLGESAKPTYIVEDGVIVIGTKGMLPPKMGHRVTDIPVLIETADDTAQPSLRVQKKTTPAIKPGELQILRQQYINNDLKLKYLFERVTKVENELIEARQKLTPSHPQVKNKASLLRALKNALQEREKEVGESFDVIMTKEIHKTNQEVINNLLDELRKTKEHQQKPSQAQPKIPKLLDKPPEPNLPPAPKVRLVSSTFVDETIPEALQIIAAAGKVTIIPDENVLGTVSCKLKNVTVETALDIVLGGTPYSWKKTPDYYMVFPIVEPSEITTYMESEKKLSKLGKSLLIYANDHKDKYPDSLFNLRSYLKWQDFNWIRENIEYLASGKMITVPPDIIIAYDKKLMTKGKWTNVLFNDGHVSFENIEKLKKLNISESEIMIETQFWSVTEDFLKDVGLDVNFEDLSDDWRGHLAAAYPAGPSGKPYGLMIDDLHLTFLLRAIRSNDDSKAIVAPRILTREGTTAEMRFFTEEYHYITDYNEPNSPSERPQPKRDKVEIGTRIWITPKLTQNNRNINMDLKLEITQLEGIIEGKYKEKYPIYKPIVDVISMTLPCTIPDGKAMLIGGLKINEHVTIKQGVPGLKDLPLIGGAFRSKDETRYQKMLLMLVKPITNPHQKATKVLPGQEDSEEEIGRLAKQLDKKLKKPAH